MYPQTISPQNFLFLTQGKFQLHYEIVNIFKLGKCISNQMKLYPNVKDSGVSRMVCWSGHSSIAKWEIGESFHLPRWFLNSYYDCIFIFSHLRQPFKNNVSRGKKGKEKKPPRQLLRVKNPLDLLIFLLWVSLISYPNDTKGLLQVSCAHDSTLKWNLTLFFREFL